jgi:DNA primase
VITLPEGEDPDTFVAKAGAEGFERAAAESVDVFDRKVQILQRTGWFGDLRRKRQALDKLLPTIRITADGLLRDLYVTRTSEVAGISRDMLERELRGGARPSHAPRDRDAGAPRADSEPELAVRRRQRRQDHHARGVRAERELVRMLLHQRTFVEPVGERLSADHMTDSAYRQIFSALVTEGADASVEAIARDLDEDATEVLQELVLENGGLERSDEVIEGSLNALLAREVSNRLSEIDRLLPLAAADEKDDLIREKKRLAKEIQSLGRPRWKSFGSTRP